MDVSITLRNLKPTDRERLAEMGNNKKIWDNLRDAMPHPYTVEAADKFIAMTLSSDPVTIKAIKCDGVHCGMIGLHPQSDVYKYSVELGYWIAEDYWGRGIATEAVRQIIEFGFRELDINRIYAGVLDFNKASARILEKNGFIYEGTAVKAAYKNGVFVDELQYGLVRD